MGRFNPLNHPISIATGGLCGAMWSSVIDHINPAPGLILTIIVLTVSARRKAVSQ